MSLTLLLRVVLLLSLLSQYLYSGCRDAILYIVVYGATRVRGSVGNLVAPMGRGALVGRSGPMAPPCGAAPLWGAVALWPRPVPRYGRGAGALDYMAGRLL